MPIDTPFVKALVAELNRTAAGARIDKVFMPAPDEVLLALRAPSVKTRLLLSANSRMPRAYFTTESRENPPAPPMFSAEKSPKSVSRSMTASLSCW